MPPGTLIALRYEVIGVIGRGGMATVYRARHLGLGIDVALKLLTRDVVAGTAAARFEREARHGARLDHRGCARVLDFGSTVDGGRYLAMELVDGPTLRAELDGGTRCRIDTAAWIGRSIAEALAHAHGRGVLHRDVKPENVMFAPDDDGAGHRVVLIDFGLSRVVEDAPLTARGACVGSPSYLAPERLLGQPGDERADLYALGVLLYELVCGRRPFIGDGVAALARQHVHSRPVPVLGLRPDAPPALAAVIHRLLEKDPDRRFASAAALAAVLADIGGEPVAGATLRHAAVTPAGHRTWRAADAAGDDDGDTASTQIALDAMKSWWSRALGWVLHGAWRWRRAPTG